jgi:cysteine-rich repeat protein
MKQRPLPTSFVLALTLLFLLIFTACQSFPIELIHDPNLTPEPTERSQEEAIDALNENASSPVIVSSSSGTSKANFVRTEEGGDLLPDYKARTPEEKVLQFFKQFGDLFGIRDPSTELQLIDKQTDSIGVNSLTYQQLYNSVAVFGGQLKARVTSDNQLTSVNGVFIVFQEVIDIVPSVPPDAATELALNLVQKQVTTADSTLAVAGTKLYIYQKGLLEGQEGTPHLAYEVEVIDSGGTIREFVYIEAHSGEVIDQVSGIHQIQRRIYDREQTPLALYWREGDAFPVDNQEVDNLITYAEDVYDFFLTMSGGEFRSWNRFDGIMHSVYNATDLENCADSPNAFWNGTFTAFCPGLPVDDVVAHEWAHAYTESTHNLVYSFQSGSLNESYSDIFGETVDRLNNDGADPLDQPRTDGSCSMYGKGTPSADDSVRWLMGEDSEQGALRDMWNPTCYGHPGKVSDPQYHCGELDSRYRFDSGGVHFNSGVPNHAFALLVDGGNYNGYTIQGIGLTKAAHIYWRAASIQTQLTDFPMHADALQTACSELALAGEVLPALSTTTTVPFDSNEVVTDDDCEQVAAAIDAVELREEPTQCPALLDPDAPPLCAVNDEVNVLATTDWESGSDSWLTGSRVLTDTELVDLLQWQIIDELPDNRPGSAMFVQDLNALCDAGDYSSVLYLESPELEIPQGVLQPRVAFTHWLASEYRFDGGNLKISVNGGEWQLVPEDALVFNPYNATLYPPIDEEGTTNLNPLAGEPAFTGATIERDGANWGQTQVNLYELATAGDTVRLRFEFGQDECTGRVGWIVDDVQNYYCSSEIAGAMCGNALLDIGESCDDGNRAAGDGCSELCTQETSYTCSEPLAPQTGSELVRDGSFEHTALEDVWKITYEDYNPVYLYTDSDAPPPSDGLYYLWFGGVAEQESASVSQIITIPTTASTLTFDLLVGACDSDQDRMEVLIDRTPVFTTTPCTVTDDYEPQSVDISQFADGDRHTLQFRSRVFAANGDLSSFFVDRVSLSDNQPIGGQPSVCTITWRGNSLSNP